jgi:hypothetical protein
MTLAPAERATHPAWLTSLWLTTDHDDPFKSVTAHQPTATLEPSDARDKHLAADLVCVDHVRVDPDGVSGRPRRPAPV